MTKLLDCFYLFFSASSYGKTQAAEKGKITDCDPQQLNLILLIRNTYEDNNMYFAFM